MDRLIDVAAEVLDEPVVDARRVEITPPWRRGAEIALGFLIVAALLLTPIARWAWIVGIAAILLARSLAPTRRILAHTPDSVALIRQSTLLRPDIGPSLIVDIASSELERAKGGLTADRWQVGQASVVVSRGERKLLERLGSADPAGAR